MMVLWDKKNINVKNLGEYLFLDSGTLTPVLKRLEQKRYIERNRDKEDERNLIVSITKLGMELRDKVKDIPNNISKCVNLNPKDAMKLYELLYKILNDFKEKW